MKPRSLVCSRNWGLDTGSTLRIEYGPRSQVSVWIESRGGRVALAHTKVEVFSLAD